MITKEILKIAFYIAKWNYVGIPNEFEIESLISKQVNLDDFKRLKNEIRCMLYQKENKSIKTSDTALKAYYECENKTISQSRFEVNFILNKLKEKLW